MVDSDGTRRISALNELEKGRLYIIYDGTGSDGEVAEMGYLVGVMNIQLSGNHRSPIGLFKDKNSYGYFTILLNDYKVNSRTGAGYIREASERQNVGKTGDALREKIQHNLDRNHGITELDTARNLS